MHSIEDLRAIRNMELLFGSCHDGERYDRRLPLGHITHYQEPQTGEVVAVLKYNLSTREITISDPHSIPQTQAL